MTLKSDNKGRGSLSQPDDRFSELSRHTVDDGWFKEQEGSIKTTTRLETAKTIIATNRSPDVPFEQSINAYRGCEHGCIYCFARPTHAYLGLSPGLDFETKLTAKTNAPELLRQQLQAKNYQCKPITLGANTDPYQPIERQHQLTRQLLQLLNEFNHPCSITTKSSLIERDIDLIAEMAGKGLVNVNLSFTTLNSELSRKLEPRATAPQRRLKTISTLSDANIPVAVLLAPVIPVLTDPEMESILSAVKQAGALAANYILLRLPLEVSELFIEWLNHYYPGMADHVINQIKSTRAGKTNDARFTSRQQGQGSTAEMIAQRFKLSHQKLGLMSNLKPLNEQLFTPYPNQLNLF